MSVFKNVVSADNSLTMLAALGSKFAEHMNNDAAGLVAYLAPQGLGAKGRKTAEVQAAWDDLKACYGTSPAAASKSVQRLLFIAAIVASRPAEMDDIRAAWIMKVRTVVGQGINAEEVAHITASGSKTDPLTRLENFRKPATNSVPNKETADEKKAADKPAKAKAPKAELTDKAAVMEWVRGNTNANAVGFAVDVIKELIGRKFTGAELETYEATLVTITNALMDKVEAA